MIVFLNYRHRDRPQQCDEDFLGSKNWYKSNKLPEIKYIDVGVDVEITTFFMAAMIMLKIIMAMIMINKEN